MRKSFLSSFSFSRLMFQAMVVQLLCAGSLYAQEKLAFLDLEDDVQKVVLSRLPGKSIVAIGKTCAHLRTLVQNEMTSPHCIWPLPYLPQKSPLDSLKELMSAVKESKLGVEHTPLATVLNSYDDVHFLRLMQYPDLLIDQLQNIPQCFDLAAALAPLELTRQSQERTFQVADFLQAAATPTYDGTYQGQAMFPRTRMILQRSFTLLERSRDYVNAPYKLNFALTNSLLKSLGQYNITEVNILLIIQLGMNRALSIQWPAPPSPLAQYGQLLEQAVNITQNKVAQGLLATFYETGTGVNQDLVQAVHWYTEAASQGYAPAQFNLAMCYSYGRGVNQDRVEAVRLYTEAANQGYTPAQFNLAICYSNGRGVNQDLVQAVHWYTQAANQRHATARFNLALCYANGCGVNQDLVQAVRLYTEAANQGYTPAQFNLATCYRIGRGVNQDWVQAVHWYTEAARQKYAPAQFNLATFYEAGTGVARDLEKALRLYQQVQTQQRTNPIAELPAAKKLQEAIDKLEKKLSKEQSMLLAHLMRSRLASGVEPKDHSKKIMAVD